MREWFGVRIRLSVYSFLVAFAIWYIDLKMGIGALVGSLICIWILLPPSNFSLIKKGGA